MLNEPKDPMLKLMLQIEEARDAGDTERAQELENNLYEAFFDQYKNAADDARDQAELADSSEPILKAAGSRNHASLEIMADALGKALKNYEHTTRLLNQRRRK